MKHAASYRDVGLIHVRLRGLLPLDLADEGVDSSREEGESSQFRNGIDMADCLRTREPVRGKVACLAMNRDSPATMVAVYH